MQKSLTAGLLKNDGTVDTNTYVQAVSGKGLSSNDYTNADQTALQTTIPLEISQLQASMLTKANSSDLGAVATSNSYDDLDDKPTIPTVSVAYSGTASSSATKKQQITVSGTSYDVDGSVYMEQDVILSTSAATTATFTNASITANSVIEFGCSKWGLVPDDITVSSGSCVVTLPKVTTSETVTVRIYLR